jgi:hypothetical protein
MGSGESWLENVDTFRLSLTTMWGSRKKKYLSKNSEITQYLLLTFHKFFGGSVYWTNQKWIMSKNSYLKNSYLLPKSGTNKYEFFKCEFFDIGHFWLVQYTRPSKEFVESEKQILSNLRILGKRFFFPRQVNSIFRWRKPSFFLKVRSKFCSSLGRTRESFAWCLLLLLWDMYKKKSFSP